MGVMVAMRNEDNNGRVIVHAIFVCEPSIPEVLDESVGIKDASISATTSLSMAALMRTTIMREE